MFERDLTGLTLAEAYESLPPPLKWWEGRVDSVVVDLVGDAEAPTVTLDGREMRFDEPGAQALCAYLDIPYKFFFRITREEQQFLLSHRLMFVAKEDIKVGYTSESRIRDVLVPTKAVIPVKSLYGLVKPEINRDWLVLNAWANARDFRLDVVVNIGEASGADDEGHPVLHGVRISQDRKNNLAPYVQPLLYHPAQGAVLEIEDWGLKIDARNATVEDIISQMTTETHRAITRAQKAVEHYLELREEEIPEDLDTALRRTCTERSCSARIADKVATVAGEHAEATQTKYLLSTIIGNFSASVDATSPVARNLEKAAGSLIVDHAKRCPTCNSKIGLT